MAFLLCFFKSLIKSVLRGLGPSSKVKKYSSLTSKSAFQKYLRKAVAT